MSWPWTELGLESPADLPEIRKAYAQRLKTTHPEEDPEGFQRLHAAYQEASRMARRRARSAPEREDTEGRAPERAHGGPPEAPETSGSPDWDYDELLKDRQAPQPPPEAAPDWDYDGLLHEEPEDPKEPEAEPESADWDYERLFAEGEAEAQAARRRKLEELREKNRARWAKQEREQRRRAEEEEASWTAVMAAAHALELLDSSGAPLSQWRRFLNDPVFLNVRANLDFVFALEDFLEQRPDLSLEIRRAIFAAYEAQNGSKYPVYNRLYKLLNVGRGEKRRAARAKSAWRTAWRSYPPWRKAVIVVCAVILAAFFSLGTAVNLRTAYEDFTARRAAARWEVQALQWLEEDYGEPFLHDASDGVFAPAAKPDLHFRASPYGERTEYWPGYQTNYPHILVRQALEDFAGERDLNLNLASYSRDDGDAPGAYLLSLPLLGAEEDVAALGALLEELSRQEWHQVPLANPSLQTEYLVREPAEYTVYLCHRGLAFYEAPSKEGFDTEEALSRYAQAGPAFCRYILENSGLAQEHLGEGTFVLADQDAAQIGDGTFFHVIAADRDSGKPRVHYFLDTGGSTLFCIPQERIEGIRFIPDLYRGAVRHLQLDKVGLVLVMDQAAESAS